MAKINNVWEFLDSLLDRLPGWPSERQLVMILTYGMGLTMLVMARNDAALWGVELFKTLITVVIVTGFINMILAFYFAANKDNEDAAANTGKAFDAISRASSGSGTDPSVLKEGDEVTLEKKDEKENSRGI